MFFKQHIGTFILRRSNRDSIPSAFTKLLIFNFFSFLLSCRAIGRGAENALWVALLKQLEKLNISVLRASYVPSSKNMQVSGLFERLGMDVALTNGSETQYVLNLPLSIDFPKWMSVDISSL